MKKVIALVIMLLLFCSSSFAATDCDVWIGTWDVTYEDASEYVWVIDEIITGTSKNIPCQAKGASTPSGRRSQFPVSDHHRHLYARIYVY